MDLYSEIILDYYKNPRNKGEIADATTTATEYNPLCGDKIKIDLLIDGGAIKDAKFSGEGCAISQAATSMLTEQIVGKTQNEVAKMKTADIIAMLNIPISPGRIKCATLGLVCTKKALIKNANA